MHARPSDGVKKHSLNAKWGWVKELRTTNIKAVNLAGGYTTSHIIYKFKFVTIQYHDKHGAHGSKRGREGATLRGSRLEISAEKQLGFILFTLKNDCDGSANNPRASRLLFAFSRSDDSNDFCSSTPAADALKSRIQPPFRVRTVQLPQTDPLLAPYRCWRKCVNSQVLNLSHQIIAQEDSEGRFDFVSSTVIQQPPWPCLKHIGGGYSFTVSLPSQQVARSFFRGSWNRIKGRNPPKKNTSITQGWQIFLQDQRAETSVSPKLFHLW